MTDHAYTLTDFDIKVLRILNGEDVPGMFWGAAMGESASFLHGRGYAEGCYTISEKGKEYLRQLDAPC